jgi:hypothetical protein
MAASLSVRGRVWSLVGRFARLVSDQPHRLAEAV